MEDPPEQKGDHSPPGVSRATFAWVSGLLVCGAAYFYFFDPAAGGVFPSCAFHRLTGWHCPGCGGQRALHEALHGRFLVALSMNALAVCVAVPAGAYLYLAFALQALTGRRVPVPAFRWTWGVCLLGAVVLFGVARNLPWGFFAWLAP